MYNIANILPTLRLCPYLTTHFVRLLPYFLMFKLLHFLYMIGFYVHIPYLESLLITIKLYTIKCLFVYLKIIIY